MKKFKIIMFNTTSKEKYHCRNCEKKYTSEEIDNFVDFRCPICGKLLIISVDGDDHGEIALERKLPNEIVEGDDIFLSEDYQYHEVLGIKEMSKDRTKFMLRGFGSRIYNDDEFVNCLAE